MGSVCMALIDKTIFGKVSDTMIVFCLNKIYEKKIEGQTVDTLFGLIIQATTFRAISAKTIKANLMKLRICEASEIIIP